ncbi:ROK family transcriptional regulator [Demequina mangrovi]|uniref:Sugar kinase of the NBD/HSP70 family, may contain an N-terminal HTH domain n=1 Tax=Demequina mangrovi TaxID=1043493 RepID=A0A1H6Y9C3_9MICO|nr:ROK family transcriptional regulator [Demequina mangrovi]SEJ37849.1 Sugar kinase of the NBD/HSP70 family, may contain an N-terminal HTH domain [Demequina mangrovi]
MGSVPETRGGVPPRGVARASGPLASLPGDAPADPSTLRSHNLGIVMRMLRDHHTLTRKDIERATGMVPASVTNLVADLADRGLVRDQRAGAGEPRGRGRPRITVEQVPDRCLGLAVRIERERLTAELHSSAGLLLDSASRTVSHGWGQPGDVADEIAALIARAVLLAAEHEGVLISCTVTVPGPVGSDARIADTLEFGWGHLDLVGLVRAAGAPEAVRIEVVNDSSAAALAEHWALPRPRPGVMLYVETGAGPLLGGGIIADGRILSGGRGYGGEIGHITVDWRGRSCACGAIGCVSTYVGPDALLASARLTELAHTAGRATALDELRARLDRGEKRAVDVALRAGDILGAALRSAYDVVNPGTVVLGGYLASLRRWLEPGIHMQLAPRSERLAPVVIESGRLGRRAGLVGAARHGLQPLFDDPTIVPSLRMEAGTAPRAGAVGNRG